MPTAASTAGCSNLIASRHIAAGAWRRAAARASALAPAAGRRACCSAMGQKSLDAFFKRPSSRAQAKAASSDAAAEGAAAAAGGGDGAGQPAVPAGAAVQRAVAATGGSSGASSAEKQVSTQQAMRAAANRNAALAKQVVIRAEQAGGVPRLADLLVEPSWRALLGPELDKEVRWQAGWSGGRWSRQGAGKACFEGLRPPRDPSSPPAHPALPHPQYFAGLEAFVASEWRGSQMVFPPKDAIFRALNACPVDQVKVGARWWVTCCWLPLHGLVPPPALACMPSCLPRQHMAAAATTTQAQVVILGQDPYHDLGQAQGLSFSVPRGKAVPSSLRNMYKELREDLGCDGAWG